VTMYVFMAWYLVMYRDVTLLCVCMRACMRACMHEVLWPFFWRAVHSCTFGRKIWYSFWYDLEKKHTDALQLVSFTIHMKILLGVMYLEIAYNHCIVKSNILLLAGEQRDGNHLTSTLLLTWWETMNISQESIIVRKKIQ
jgi:hypothetical protein